VIILHAAFPFRLLVFASILLILGSRHSVNINLQTLRSGLPIQIIASQPFHQKYIEAPKPPASDPLAYACRQKIIWSCLVPWMVSLNRRRQCLMDFLMPSLSLAMARPILASALVLLVKASQANVFFRLASFHYHA